MSDRPPWLFSLPDLHEFPPGTMPSPYQFMVPERHLPAGLRLLAVGWIDGPDPFPTGASDPEVVSRLLGLGRECLIDEGTAGWHCCYYCGEDEFDDEEHPDYGSREGIWLSRPACPFGKGHHLVRFGDAVYMCPALLPHYVVVHGYRPPDVFVRAVLEGRFLADSDLIRPKGAPKGRRDRHTGAWRKIE